MKDKVTWLLSFLRIGGVNVLTIMNRNNEPSLKGIRFPNLRDSLLVYSAISVLILYPYFEAIHQCLMLCFIEKQDILHYKNCSYE